MKPNTMIRFVTIKKGKMFSRALVLLISLSFYYSCSNQQNKEGVRSYECARYNNGNIEILGMRVDSLKQGLWLTFYPSGQLKSIHYYKDDEEEGPIDHFYENGQLNQHMEFRNGALHGKLVLYYKNGKLIHESYRVNGLLDGIYKELIDDDFYNINEYDMGEHVRTIEGFKPISLPLEELK